MISQIGLRECFMDTQFQVKSDKTLKEKTQRMQAGTQLYFDHFVSMIGDRKRETLEVSVVEDTAFSCAAKLTKAGGKTAVLNFANTYNPGGSVKDGVMAQEECLCRSSNLYESLILPYIVRHYYKWNQKNTGDMGSDRIIYSPEVTVFKSDDIYPVILSPEQWHDVDVITCVAPYYDKQKKKPVSLEKLEQVFHDRIRNILGVAVANDVDNLVLGSFGCGAFHNPPELVANVFKKLLIDGGYAALFKNVVFAIKKSGERCENLDAFRKAFSEEKNSCE